MKNKNIECKDQVTSSLPKKPMIPPLDLRPAEKVRDELEKGTNILTAPLSTGRRRAPEKCAHLSSIISARGHYGARAESVKQIQSSRAQEENSKDAVRCYDEGMKEESKNPENALRSFQLGAILGHAPSFKKVGEVAFHIGSGFHNNESVSKSGYLKALHYFRIAEDYKYGAAPHEIGKVSYKLARIIQQEGDLPEALTHLKEGVKRGHPDCISALDEINSVSDKSKYRGIEKLKKRLQELQAKRSTNPAEEPWEIGIVALEIAKIKLNKKKIDEALSYLKTAIKHNNKEAWGYYIPLIQEDPLKVLKFYRKQIKFGKNNEDQALKYNYGLALENLGFIFEAIPLLADSNINPFSNNEKSANQAIEDWQTKIEESYKLGMDKMEELDRVLSKKNIKEEEVFKLLDEAEDLFTFASIAGHASAMLQLALIHELYESYDEARELFDKLAAHGDLEGVCGLARLNENQDPKLSEKLYKKGTKLSDEGYFDLAKFYSRQGRTEDASQCYKNILARDPTNILAYYNLGFIYAEKGGFIEARKNFNLGLNCDPSSGLAYFNLGLICAAEGNLRQAHKNFTLARDNKYYMRDIETKTFFEKIKEVNPNFIMQLAHLYAIGDLNTYATDNLKEAKLYYRQAKKIHLEDAKKNHSEMIPRLPTFPFDITELVFLLYIKMYPAIDGFVFEVLEDAKKMGEYPAHFRIGRYFEQIDEITTVEQRDEIVAAVRLYFSIAKKGYGDPLIQSRKFPKGLPSHLKQFHTL